MQLMQRYGKTIQLGLTLAMGIVLAATALRPQMPNGVPAVGPAWEYASITASIADTRLAICYADVNGCGTNPPIPVLWATP